MSEDALITPVRVEPAHDRELVLGFLIKASPEAIYRCWTDPALLVKWFAPRPLETTVLSQDFRVGGVQAIVMKDPSSGAEYPASGVFLEIVPNRKIVSTDAFTADWQPVVGAPFMVAQTTFEPQADGRTLYIARARHWSPETVEQHKQMGFEPGWTQCAHQLAELAASL
ncbi:SRPBCC domain-containing protein [Phenylobacterium immobile]|uniref:SRPBCC domain-containing protein n=1 Tax=Phenylobacterium immobile TaxID=21 RepID=UPI000AB40509|nr:SRPBCC domain-containing protein [Phenylobacterium immobile]